MKPKHRGAAGFNVCFSKATGEITGVYDFDEDERMYDDPTQAPYQPGDVLYVRETWKKVSGVPPYIYKATYSVGEVKWCPSIHMPKEAARLFLRVKDVRVERLQDMKMSDMQAEGAVPSTVTGGQWQQWQRDFMKPLWNSTIKSADLSRYGWDANPWVWVIEFEKTKGA